MTVSSTISRSGPYAGAGTTGPFAVGFRFLEDAHLRVVKTNSQGVDADLILGIDFFASGAGEANGSVILVAPLATNERLTILRAVPATQEADYVQNDAFPAESHERALDKLTMIAQQQAEQLGRTLRLGVSVNTNPEFPSPSPNKFIGWDSAGTRLVNADIAALSEQFVYADWRYETFTGDGTQVQFLLAGAPSNIANAAVSINGLVKVPVSEFTLDGNILTFATPPAVGATVLVRYGKTIGQSGGLQTITKQVATAGQTVFTLADSYPSNQSAIAAYVNGLRMEGAAVDFTETSDTTVTFSRPLAAGDSVIFVVGSEVTGSGPGAVSLATGSNVGSGAGLLFRDVTDDGIDRKLNLKTIAAGNGVTVTNGADTVQLAVNVGAGLSFDGSGKLVASTAAGVLNVKAAPFNALGDGVTNDTAAIQAALNYAAANNLSLHFPAGTYIASGLTYIATYLAHLTISGEGSGNTTLQAPSGTTSPVFTLGVGGLALGPNQILFQGLTFRGNYPASYRAVATSYTQHAFLVDTANHILFDDCRFRNGVNGLSVRNGVITHLHRCGAWYNEVGFYVATPGVATAGTTTFLDKSDAKSNYRWGVYFDDGRMLTMSACTIEGNGGKGAAASGGLYVGEFTGGEGGAGFKAIGAVIDTTWFEANSGTAAAYLRSGINTLRDCNFSNSPTEYVIMVSGGRYFLERLVFENPKTYHIYEFALASVLTGNSIVNCYVGASTNTPANVFYDVAKTSINFGGGGGGAAVTVSGNNVGTGAGLLYRGAVDGAGTRTLEFKTLFASTGISLTNAGDTVNVAVAPATVGVIGGVRPGAGLLVDGSGVLTVAAAVGAWFTATLDAGWSNYTTAAGAVRYRKEGDIVRLAGAIQYSPGTPSGAPAFTLPAGFRPGVTGFVAASASGGANTNAVVTINATTGVVDVTATNAIVFLDGITFPTT